MKVFHYSGSINFIDENDVFLGYVLEQSCNERSDFNISWDRKFKKKIEYKDVSELDSILDGYLFDTHFMLKYYDSKNTDRAYAIFRLKKNGEKNIYISLSNQHNGYYSHGFSLSQVDMSNFNFEDDEETSGDVDDDGYYEVISNKDYYSEEYNSELRKYLMNDAPRIQYFFRNHI